MGKIVAGVTLMQDFCRPGTDTFQSYIDYIDREEAQRNQAIKTYNLFNDYMGNPEKSTGLFTEGKNHLTFSEKSELKDVFQKAQNNGSIMWQTVISFDNLWLEKNGLYDSKNGFVDETKIKETVRIAVRRMLEKEGLENAVWSAGIHYNTDNLHVHIATVEPYPMRKTMLYQGKEEYRGKFKLKNLELCKSSVVNEIMQTREVNLKINNIIRKDIVAAKKERQLSEDVDIRKKFLRLYEEVANIPQNMIHYNNGIMSRQRTLIDEISISYLEKYHKETYEEFQNLVKRQSDLYSEAYGRYDRFYEESKTQDLMERLGNAVLKEVKTFEKEIDKSTEAVLKTEPVGNSIPYLVQKTEVKNFMPKENVTMQRGNIQKLENTSENRVSEKIPFSLKMSAKEMELSPELVSELELAEQILYSGSESENPESSRMPEQKENEELQEKRITYITELAEKGNETAQVRLGCEYLKGVHVDRNVDEARKWFSAAAEQGNDIAGEMLEQIHQNGREYRKSRRGMAELDRALCELQKSFEMEHRKSVQMIRQEMSEMDMEEVM